MANELKPFNMPLKGRLILSKDPVMLDDNFQSYKNLRSYAGYPKGVGGMTPINTSAPSTGGATTYPRIRHAIHFRKEGDSSDFENTLVYAYTSSLTNPKIFRHTQNVPTTGNFNTTPVFTLTDTTTEREGKFSLGCNGTVGFCDGKDALIWGGDEYQLGRFINFNTAASINKDYTEQLRNTLTNTQNRAILTKSTTMLFYIGATMPLQGFKCYFDGVSTKNNSTGTLAVQYWSGTAWTAVSSLVDGTSSGNKPLRVTGAVSFANTASLSKPRIIDNTMLHWYRVSSSGVATNSHMAQLTVNTPMQPIVDIWDGEMRDTVSFKLWNTTKFNEYAHIVIDDEYIDSSSQTYVNIAGANYYLLCGFLDRTSAVDFHIIGGSNNNNVSTLTVQYSSDGFTWTNVSGLIDETSSGGKSMKASGVVSWQAPDKNTEFQSVAESTVSLWYYKFSLSATLTSPTPVYYTSSIPSPKNINGYKHMALFKNRIWLINNEDGKKNSIMCSAVDAPNVFNGKDTVELSFGDKSEINGAIALYVVIGSNIFDSLILFKKNAMFGFTGNTPDDFQKYEIMATDGLAAPRTLTRTFTYLGNNPISTLIWQGSQGIYVFDNKTPMPIHEDIRNFFDPRESASRRLHASYIEKSVGWIDQQNYEYHWHFADGNSTGNLNREFVFNFIDAHWFEIDRGSSADLQFGFELQDTNAKKYYYGIQNNGIMCRLENGNTFNGNTIAHELWTSDMVFGKEHATTVTALRKLKLIAKSTTATAANIIVKHYVDGETNASSSFTLSPVSSGNRIIRAKKSMSGQNQGNFHSLKINISTSNEAVGFTPLFLGGFYEVVREDI